MNKTLPADKILAPPDGPTYEIVSGMAYSSEVLASWHSGHFMRQRVKYSETFVKVREVFQAAFFQTFTGGKVFFLYEGIDERLAWYMLVLAELLPALPPRSLADKSGPWQIKLMGRDHCYYIIFRATNLAVELSPAKLIKELNALALPLECRLVESGPTLLMLELTEKSLGYEVDHA